MASPMLASSLRELKYHPARYVSTIVAIAISVGFVAASSILTATESQASARQISAPYSQADLIMNVSDSPEALKQSQIVDAASATPGVQAVEPIYSSTMILTHNEFTALSTVTALPSERFIWTKLKEGTWPHGDEIALNPSLAKTLEVGIGGQVTYGDKVLSVVGIITDPPGTLMGDPAVGAEWAYETSGDWVYYGDWVVALDPTADPAEVSAKLTTTLSSLGVKTQMYTAKEYDELAARMATNNVDSYKYILWIFAGIAMVVGLITISNTFTILLAQRRRQIGLMRSIGASGKQIRHSIWAEALILGLVGGLLGIALACALTACVGLFTGSIHYGIQVPWRDASVAVALGFMVTMIAAIVPSFRSTRVPPLEAQPVTADLHTAKVSIARAVICGVMVVAGFVGAFLSLKAESRALMVAVASSAVLAVGILFGARLFVPHLLKAAGRLVRGFGPAGSAAAKNVVRDPARAAATSTALMLAVGLIITLQVGAASIGMTIEKKAEIEFPVDLYVASFPDAEGNLELPRDLQQKLNEIDEVGKTLAIPCRSQQVLIGETENIDRVCSYIPELAQFAPGLPQKVAADEILVSNWSVYEGQEISLKTGGQPAVVTAAFAPVVMSYYSFVSPEVYAQLTGVSHESSMIFVSVTETSSLVSVLRSIQEIIGENAPIADYDGAIFQKYQIEQALGIIVAVVTALLAVAVLIALVGVGNTLTLSVIERGRENAILRTLGFQRSQLRVMLLIEAALLTLVGGIVGLIAGAFYGWLGANAIIAQFASEGYDLPVYFSINWVQTVGLLLVLLIAAGLASVLPGRRAAKASPIEALAEV